ncbi:MAG: hypothetical protein HYT42_02260 [Candidatus Sungbacteria bacterium]|nr:hypothetical protein [Candidatus Sungbacteria bacterium]
MAQEKPAPERREAKMTEKQYATPRFAKGSAGIRFTDKSTGQQFSAWNGDGYTVVGVVPHSSWNDPSVPEYFITRSRSAAEGRYEDILAAENELETTEGGGAGGKGETDVAKHAASHGCGPAGVLGT